MTDDGQRPPLLTPQWVKEVKADETSDRGKEKERLLSWPVNGLSCPVLSMSIWPVSPDRVGSGLAAK